jgi:hypothetical protein
MVKGAPFLFILEAAVAVAFQRFDQLAGVQ